MHSMEALDLETGEYTQVITLNCETGEEEYLPPLRTYRTTFKIPTNYIDKSNDKKESKIQYSSCEVGTTAILFLLPTTIFFYPILSLIVVSLEIILHVWAHKKNKTLKNKNLCYRSPLHIICKEFCAPCREENMKLKITKIQDKRNDKLQKYGLEYVRGIVT